MINFNIKMLYSNILRVIIILFFLFCFNYGKSQIISTGCNNAGFENGNFTNWTGYTGTFSNGNLSLTTVGVVNNRQTIMSIAGEDPNTVNAATGHGISYIAPNGSLYSCKLGNSIIGTPVAERLTYTINVNSQNDMFYYWYAVVLQDPGHAAGLQPSFKIEILNSSGQIVDNSCGYYYVYAKSGIPGFYNSTASSYNADVCCKAWSVVGVDLSSYIGQNITIQFTTTHCGNYHHYGYAYIDAGCAPMSINLNYCSGATVATATAPTGFTYSWTGPGITTPVTTQTLNITNIVTGSVYSCVCTSVTGCSVTLTTTIFATSVISDFSYVKKCQNIIFTDLSTVTGPGIINSWLWDFGDGTTSILQNPTHIYSSPGIYTVKLTVTVNGCNSTYSKIIDVNPPPIIVGSNSPVCYGNNLSLTASGGITYLWSGPNGFLSTEQNPKIIKPAINDSGKYFVSVSDSSCTYIDSVNVSIYLSLLVSPQPDTSICKMTTYQLAANVSGGILPLNIYWNGILSNDTIYVTTANDTTLSVYVTDANGCLSNTNIVKINVFPNVRLKLEADNDTICKNSEAAINATITSGNGGPYSTFFVDGTPVTFPIKVYPDSSQNYIVYAKDMCGSFDIDTIRIVVISEPPMTFISNINAGCQPLSVCFNEPKEWQSYIWDFGDGSSYSNEENPTHVFDEPGIFDVILNVTSNYGCKYTFIHNNMITVYHKPSANFTANPNIASIINPIIYFSNNSVNSLISYWTFGTGDSSNLINPAYTYKDNGTYNVRLIVMSTNGCMDTVFGDIIIKDIFTFYAPTAFSPDNDNINDKFNVFGNGVDPYNFHLYIFDRWGEMIFETTDINKGWDGKYKSKILHDSYTWLAIFKDMDGVEYTKCDKVILIK